MRPNVLTGFVLALGLLFWAVEARSAQAAPQPVPRIELSDFGLYRAGRLVRMLPPSPAGIGQAITDGFEHLRTTRLIPGTIGITFGFRYRIIGAAPAATVPVTTVSLFPPPGVDSPYSGRLVLRDESSGELSNGGEGLFMTTFEYDWEIVPGTWIIEVWSDGRKLGEQRFEISTPVS